ncbi:hypothetical protein RHGRI_007813 [Rhododendron griersonianum]|nr:hypothetical protein RHGRI_007813 [Rhododendron griersonianum]
MSEDDGMDRSITNRYPNEYLNSLDPTGLPAFKLALKVGCPIILLRNIAPKDGLCNGTRMMVVRCGSHIIEVKILTGEKFGKLVFLCYHISSLKQMTWRTNWASVDISFFFRIGIEKTRSSKG